MPMKHDFWLFREGERAYTEYRDLSSRHDAPVKIDDEILRYCVDTLRWIPTFNPAKNERGNGLNWWGPTIIRQESGDSFHHVFAAWAHMFSCGPEHFQLRGTFSWLWPYDESEHLISEAELHTMGSYTLLQVDRDNLVHQFAQLANFGVQTATGSFFILHLGI